MHRKTNKYLELIIKDFLIEVYNMLGEDLESIFIGIKLKSKDDKHGIFTHFSPKKELKMVDVVKNLIFLDAMKKNYLMKMRQSANIDEAIAKNKTLLNMSDEELIENIAKTFNPIKNVYTEEVNNMVDEIIKLRKKLRR